ncbi:hypothetical protein DV515_00012886, partial [Chloebia gouldiae]
GPARGGTAAGGRRRGPRVEGAPARPGPEGPALTPAQPWLRLRLPQHSARGDTRAESRRGAPGAGSAPGAVFAASSAAFELRGITFTRQGRRTLKIFKKSSIPGVVITQFVNDIPQGCSTPDFEKKPLSLTLQEGKNAIFRAVVKGVPAPEVKWSRTTKGMDDPAKYEMSFNSATNEFILQIKSLVLDDSDLYRCCAVNAYGEASCSAGLRIIQVGFKRKAKYVPVHAADELKKTLLDSKRLLRKRVAAPKPKPLDKEAVWQLLLHADRRDYEKICMKYGIADFRGMLRKLQEIRKDTESEQDKLIHSLKNFEHIKVNKEGNATFSLEMELKNSNSNVYLLKDGERLRYGTGDEYRKHCLRRVGRRYYFTVNDVQPEDAGVYQVRVEDIPVFSTELDAQAIPARFRQPLSDVRCAEAGDAEFQCVLCTPCHQPLWLHKSHPLQASDKHQISVTPDGLTHKLIVRNAGPSDSGLYTLDAGQGSSSAWLLVEYDEVAHSPSVIGKMLPIYPHVFEEAVPVITV